jgi:uncharacterized protein YjiS (DUF1127 family)
MLLSLRRTVFVSDLSRRVAEIRRVIEGRRAIARMDARMLADIGLSRSAALEEINRRPWDYKK